MTSQYLLIAPTGNKNSFKALITAEYGGLEIDVPPFEWGLHNKSEEFLKWTPIAKVPVLKTPSGPIFESNAIAKFLAKASGKAVGGSGLFESALIDQWTDFSTNELDIPLSKWGGPLHGYGPRIKEVEDAAIAASKRGLAALNKYLKTRTYLVGDTITVADIVTVCNLYNPIRGLLSAEFMAEYPHVQRYFFTLVNQPNFKKFVGEVVQISATPTEVLPKEASIRADVPVVKSRDVNVEKPKAEAPAEAKPKKEIAKKEEKKAEEPSASAIPAEEDEAPKPKPAKNPLDLLPPSPMIMDAWKRLYSNTKAKDFKEVAIKGFWEMYDAEGYSLWFCDYKYNDENQVGFVTMNKVSGFLQRMEVVRKHGFAKMAILGEGPFSIKGVWLFRGPDVPQVVKDEVYDSELYDWTKVDISDEAQKNLVNDYFEEPDVVAGLPLVECKCFK